MVTNTITVWGDVSRLAKSRNAKGQNLGARRAVLGALSAGVFTSNSSIRGSSRGRATEGSEPSGQNPRASLPPNPS